MFYGLHHSKPFVNTFSAAKIQVQMTLSLTYKLVFICITLLRE